MIAKPILKGLYQIPSGVANTFFIDSPDGCVLIDTGYPGSEEVIIKAIEELGSKLADIRYILLTHAHPDHIGGYAALKKATGAEGFVHPLDAPLVTSRVPFRPLTAGPGFITGLMFRQFIKPADPAEPAPVEHLIEDGQVLDFAGGFKAVHTPGHCAGHLAFLWGQHGGVMFAADVCSNMMGLSYSLGYEDLEEGKRSLRKVGKLEFQVATFGHGNAIMQDAASHFRKKWG